MLIGVHVSVTGVYNANQWSSQKAFKESKADNFWYYTRTINYIKPIPFRAQDPTPSFPTCQSFTHTNTKPVTNNNNDQ